MTIQLAIHKPKVLSRPFHHPLRSFCEKLEDVVVGFDHYIKDSLDVLIRHFLVEEVGHGIHENHLRFSPTERHFQPLGPELQIKPLFIRVIQHTAEPFGKRLGVTVLAPRTDFRAAGNGIPGGIGPFDMRLYAHDTLYPSSNSN